MMLRRKCNGVLDDKIGGLEYNVKMIGELDNISVYCKSVHGR